MIKVELKYHLASPVDKNQEYITLKIKGECKRISYLFLWTKRTQEAMSDSHTHSYKWHRYQMERDDASKTAPEALN
jgi:ABC-type transporter Mla MlaB component